MAVTIEHTGNPVFPWRVSSECVTKAEAFAKGARVEEVVPEAFQPVPQPEMLHHAMEAPMPPLVVMHEADDDGPDGLKAGEAYREHGA